MNTTIPNTDIIVDHQVLRLCVEKIPKVSSRQAFEVITNKYRGV